MIIDSKKLTEEFIKEHGIIPTEEERLIIEIAIVYGAKEQIGLWRDAGYILM